jgi:valyl-tRNA synthetase
MAKTYKPAEHEARIWDLWTRAGAFRADPARVLSGQADPYCVLIPPPNVTAALHLGHALNNTVQDILVRAHRMKGFETLWMPGTDHAGIATQTVVDRRLKAEGKPALAEHKQMEARGEGGREKFVAQVQAWKDEYERVITGQLQKMGCSCDWERQRFTMDPVCARAVREAFFRLFCDGLIERGKRLVNWDPVTQTALADDEVEMREVEGIFAYLRYPLVHPAPDSGARGAKKYTDHSPVTWGELVARKFPGAENHPDDQQAWVTVATTRPETYLGDVAVAVNPKDPRAHALRGLLCELPLVGRRIPIIEDDYVVLPVALGGDPADAKAQLATGFLKVTPAHDPNDYELGMRHRADIEARCSAHAVLINVMAPDASISAAHGWPDYDPHAGAEVFVGLSREAARKKVLDEFRARSVAGGPGQSLLEGVKPHVHSVGHSYRSHAAIEPYLSDQWYCRVSDDRLRGTAQRALRADQRTKESMETWPESKADAGSDGKLTFHPARYAKSYETWHDNLRDWCISRQLWWGHRIPVWSGPAPAPVEPGPDVAIVQDGAAAFVCLRTDDHSISLRLESAGFTQDSDVLDTWFSSALWPLSTLGWPDADAASRDTGASDFPALLDAFNPTSVLCTAREIITLWVSRMVMFNRYFLGDDGASRLPFKDVFIHAMIQDGEGRKMSKSLGNGVDPLDIIDSHGADAMRFTLCQMTTQTQDVRMPVEKDAATGKNTSPKFDLGRNVANKLWNAARFTIMMLDAAPRDDAATPVRLDELSLVDRWMLSRLAHATGQIDLAIRDYQFKDYADALYDLFWRDFCDWYLEAVKPTIAQSAPQRAVLRTVLDAVLRLAHPVMPFITEAIFEQVRGLGSRGVDGLSFARTRADTTLCQSGWPVCAPGLRDEVAEEAFERVRTLVTTIREVRAAKQVAPKRRVTLHASAALAADVARWAPLVQTLAGVERVTADAAPAMSSGVTFEGVEHRVSNLADAADAGAERDRLTKQLADLDKSIAALEGRLNNPGYAQRAPEKLVQQTRDELGAKQAERDLVRATLDRAS